MNKYGNLYHKMDNKEKEKISSGQELIQSNTTSRLITRIDHQVLINRERLSHRMGKPTICIGENKGADQLRGNREADQRLCFRYSDRTASST